MTLGLVIYDCCTSQSYSGSICAKDTFPVHAFHGNGRQSGHGMGQEAIYMMTCIPLPNPEDLKVLIK
jgi:hypothetical protein